MNSILNYRFYLMILISLFLFSCDKELDVKTDFHFELEIMPVPKSLLKGMIKINYKIKMEGYINMRNIIRYFNIKDQERMIYLIRKL